MENSSYFESIKININLNNETLSDDDDQLIDNLQTFKKPEQFGFYHYRQPSPINELNIHSGTVITNNLLSEIELSESEDESQMLMCFMKSEFTKPSEEDHYEDFTYFKKDINKNIHDDKVNNVSKNMFITTNENTINIKTVDANSKQQQLQSTNNIICIKNNSFNQSECKNKLIKTAQSTFINMKDTKYNSPHLSIKRTRKRNKNVK